MKRETLALLTGRKLQLAAPLLLGLITATVTSNAIATDYTWTAVSTTVWNSGSWAGSPAVNASTGPVAGDDITAPLNTTVGILRVNGVRTVNSITFGGGNTWTIESLTSSTLNVGQITYNGSTTSMNFRSSSAAAGLSISATNVVLNGGVLGLGTASGAGNALLGLNVSGTTLVNSGTMSIVTNTGSSAYSLGLLSVNGSSTTQSVVRLNAGAPDGRHITVSVTGVTGTGGSISNYGSVANSSSTLLINNSVNYETGAAFFDGNTAGTLGKLAIRKEGTAYQSLTAASTYSGGTVVAEGTLYANHAGAGSSTGVGAVTVETTGTLGGVGRIAPTNDAAVTIDGTLAPGFEGSAATLTFAMTGESSLIFNSTAQLDFTLGTISDLVAFEEAGDWLSGSGNLTLNLALGEGFSYASDYTVFSNVTTAGFGLAGITGYDTENFTADFHQVGSDYVISFNAVPEPATVGLFGLASVWLGLAAYRKRKR